MINPYETQQKRIAFLALHRDLMGNVGKNIELKAHDELVNKVYEMVDALFEKYQFANGKVEPSITKAEENLPY